jgi:hypothetical protein
MAIAKIERSRFAEYRTGQIAPQGLAGAIAPALAPR